MRLFPKAAVLYLCVVLLLAVSFLASCGGSSGGGGKANTVYYSIGGTVVNLAGSGGGLKLLDNGGDTLNVNANGTFVFASKLTSGSSYDVTISAQPTLPRQTCGVTKSTGVVTADVTTVEVDCGHNEWTWVSGSDLGNQPGAYGTEGTAAPGNVPGARAQAVSWTDTSGNLWLFGGTDYTSTFTATVFLNDLWKYSGGEWTWVSGSNVVNQPGTYGTEGTAAPGNVPGARAQAVSWTDTSGNLWLFGGTGYDSAGTLGYLNDLWKYSGGEWTWVSGSNVVNQPGTYGTEGTAATGNVPGARAQAVSWTDTSGNLWLFGGEDYTSTSRISVFLNDLWKYSGGEWTWMNGSNVVNQPGTYGTPGTPAPGNVPGARFGPVAWTDTSGNLWLFGGEGYASTLTYSGELSDLWKYGGGEWTWMNESNVIDQPGTYGTEGTAAWNNLPGARFASVAWTDKSSDLWIFGGHGWDSADNLDRLNDVWKYHGGEWTWTSGSNVIDYPATYGTEGTAAWNNLPGARAQAVSWIDASGNLWLFGGYGYDSVGNFKRLNDLWRYEP